MNWAEEFGAAITVCDTEANILYMNDRAKATFSKYGDSIIGRNLREFHGDKAWEQIRNMIDNSTDNHYTIRKGDVKKIIHQEPWFKDGKVAGLVEMSFEIPFDMQHFDRG